MHEKDNVKAIIETKQIPTYLPKDAMKLPMFFEKKQYQGASGHIYPLPVGDTLSDDRVEHPWEVGVLENEYIYIEILPQIGGKIKRALDKKHNYDFMYHNAVIKPAGIGIAGPWISGGVEFNWPQHHRPTTFSPVETTIEELPDGTKTIWVGETEPLYRTKGMAGISVEPGRSYVKMKARVYNPTPFPQPFMWWANLAAPATESYRIVFPPDVEYVVDHDRRAVMSWPIAKGVYNTARPYDFGSGTDLSRYSEIKTQASFMVPMGQSRFDFVSGYDEEKQLGIVSVSDHNVAPGKKLFTWGVTEHGDMWSKNLTDENGPYIEIMTGAYTDNQPDFAWIAPYETKEFEQYWYPISGIGTIKNATVDAAINVESTDGKLSLGVSVTGRFGEALVEVLYNQNELFRETVTLTPDEAFVREIELPARVGAHNITASVKDKDGRVLVDYKPVNRGEKQPPLPRLPAKKPEEIETNDELYINGLHLLQYRHHTFVPEDYFLEALRRDPGDIRCNTELGKSMLSRGMFREAVMFFDRAIERLTSRNETPYDPEAFYHRGVALRFLQKREDAYDSIYKSVWQYAFRAAGYFLLAELDAANGDYDSALRHLDLSLETNTKNNRAKTLKAAVLRKLGRAREARTMLLSVIEEDKLDCAARMELYLLNRDDSDAAMALASAINDKPDYAIDLAIGYINAGFFDDAMEALTFTAESPMTLFYLGYCQKKIGDNDGAVASYKKADAYDSSYCFPSRLEDIAVLKSAIHTLPDGAMAPYYLGCLFYDKERYDDAITCFEHAKLCDDSFSHTWRNLAIAYFDKKQSFFDARMHMQRALSLDNDPRLFYEYQQLLKNMGDSPAHRLSLYDRFAELGDARDDSFIEKTTLVGMQGNYTEALDMAKDRQFHVYEGGEGLLPRLHAWMHILEGNRLYRDGSLDDALAHYEQALVIPENYGEARNPLAEEGHIFFHIGVVEEKRGNYEEATAAYYTAAIDKGLVSELNLWRAFALMKIGKGQEAQQVLFNMIETGEETVRNKDDYPYFGGGNPAPLPFENDIAKKNTIRGLILQAYGYLGLGQYGKAKEMAGELRKIDPYNFSLYVFGEVAKDM